MAVKVFFLLVFLSIFLFSLIQSLPVPSSVDPEKENHHNTDSEPLVTICFHCSCFEGDLLDCSERNLELLNSTFFDVVLYRFTRLNFYNSKNFDILWMSCSKIWSYVGTIDVRKTPYSCEEFRGQLATCWEQLRIRCDGAKSGEIKKRSKKKGLPAWAVGLLSFFCVGFAFFTGGIIMIKCKTARNNRMQNENLRVDLEVGETHQRDQNQQHHQDQNPPNVVDKSQQSPSQPEQAQSSRRSSFLSRIGLSSARAWILRKLTRNAPTHHHNPLLDDSTVTNTSAISGGTPVSARKAAAGVDRSRDRELAFPAATENDQEGEIQSPSTERELDPFGADPRDVGSSHLQGGGGGFEDNFSPMSVLSIPQHHKYVPFPTYPEQPSFWEKVRNGWGYFQSRLPSENPAFKLGTNYTAETSQQKQQERPTTSPLKHDLLGGDDDTLHIAIEARKFLVRTKPLSEFEAENITQDSHDDTLKDEEGEELFPDPRGFKFDFDEEGENGDLWGPELLDQAVGGGIPFPDQVAASLAAIGQQAPPAVPIPIIPPVLPLPPQPPLILPAQQPHIMVLAGPPEGNRRSTRRNLFKGSLKESDLAKNGVKNGI